MARCELCGEDMCVSKGCIGVDLYPINSETKYSRISETKYSRIKVGDPGDFYEGDTDVVCGDCGAAYGYYHHVGCDCEICPKCGGQLLSCDCELEYQLIKPRRRPRR